MTLEQARDKARQWDALIAQGIDPAVDERRKREAAIRAAQAASENSFAARVPQFLHLHRNDRQVKEVARVFNRHLLPAWGDRPLAEIEARDITSLVSKIAANTPSMARSVLSVIKNFFNWAVDNAFVATSPAVAKPARLVGKKPSRSRFLSDAEIAALWRATEAFGYPHGQLMRFLLLTGTRRGEAAGARWDEIDLDAGRWVIPPERYKSEVEHVVPLSDMAVALLKSLPRSGPFVFSYNNGNSPVKNYSQAKREFDPFMAEALGKAPAPWTVHDLRRTARTKLASLGISDTIAEIAIGHAKKGLERVYDQHRYEPELRVAFERLAGAIRDIVTPPDPDKIVKLKQPTAAA
jgi:integrase